MRDELQARAAIEKYGDTVRRICFMHLKSYSDVEDIFQEVFLKYVLYKNDFESDAHEKAWLIRVTINACKDILKSFFRKNTTSIDNLINQPYCFNDVDANMDVVNAILALPEKYKDVIFLFYYIGYSVPEISHILNKKENTVYTWLNRARAQLKVALGGDFIAK